MDYPPRIQELIERYWLTETSLKEEKELRNYFMLHPESADQTTAYFLFLQLESSIESGQELRPVEVNTRPRIIRVLSIAAAVLLLVTAGIYFEKQSRSTTQDALVIDSFEDPNEAYEEAREALLLISQRLNASQNQARAQIARATPYTEILK